METMPENTVADSDYWRINKKKTKRWLISLPIAIVLLFLALSAWLSMNSSSPKRERTPEFLLSLSAARNAITEQLRANPQQAVDTNLVNLIPSELNFNWENERVQIGYKAVSPEGRITAFSPQLGVLAVLTPQIENNKVVWSCWLNPPKFAPASCRGPEPSALDFTSAR